MSGSDVGADAERPDQVGNKVGGEVSKDPLDLGDLLIEVELASGDGAQRVSRSGMDVVHGSGAQRGASAQERHRRCSRPITRALARFVLPYQSGLFLPPLLHLQQCVVPWLLQAPPGPRRKGSTMNAYTMTKVDPDVFAIAYNLGGDYDYLDDLRRGVRSLRPMFRSQSVNSHQAWLDSFAQITHQTTQRHDDDFIVFTCDADDFLTWVDALLAEVTS